MKKLFKKLIILSLTLLIISSCNNNSSENDNFNKKYSDSDISSNNSSNSQITTYTVTGFVTANNDLTNPKPISGVVLTLTNILTKKNDNCTTDNEGKYEFINIKNGNYELKVVAVPSSAYVIPKAKEFKVKNENVTLSSFILEYDGSSWGKLQ